MHENEPCITKQDRDRLEACVSRAAGGSRDGAHLKALSGLLARLKVVEQKAIGADIVTMHSRVKIMDIDTKEMLAVTLVYPEDADIELGKMSVLSPVGTAILGCRRGEVVEWAGPRRLRRILIKEIVYQPEAAGNYAL